MNKKKKSQFARYSWQDKTILSIGYFLIGLFVVAIIVPMIYIVVASFIDGVCFSWDVANIDNLEDWVPLPALTADTRNITPQNGSFTSGFDRGRCVVTAVAKEPALVCAWLDQMYDPFQSPQNNWGTYDEQDDFDIFELGKNADGADMMLSEEEIDEDLIKNSRIFHFGTLSMTHEGVRAATKKAIDIAKENNVLISFDPNLREPLWDSLDDAREQFSYGMSKCDILKISDNEIEWYTGEKDYTKAVEIIRSKYDIPLILVTMGKAGSRAYYKDLFVEKATIENPDTIETTGAGDTFHACVLNYILENGIDNLSEKNLEEMLLFANVAASIITTRKGALCVMPEKEEIEVKIASL